MEDEAIAMMGANVSLMELGLRLLIDLICMIVLIRGIYYRLYRQKDFMFTFFLFNVVIFMTCLLLSSARIKLGFAFGLFAIFSIMRYRTVTIPVKEMGYFFVCVAVGILNALVSAENNYTLLLAADGIIILLVYLLDHYFAKSNEIMKEIVYERIDLIIPEKRSELLADLKTRTGLSIHRIEIQSIDLLHDSATINAYYYTEDRK